MASGSKILKIIGVFEDKITNKFRNLSRDASLFRERVAQINSALAPLNTTLAKLTGAFISFAAVKKAIDLAREQEEVQLKLKVALEENIDLFQELLDFASQRQSQTFFGDEQTVDVLQKLLAFNVPIDKLKEFTIAAQNIATTGVLSLDAAVAQLATTVSGEVTFLGRRFKAVKQLSEEELRRGEAARVINEQLGDLAREVTRTPFGLFQQELNIINDEFERIGRVLIKIIVPSIVRAREAFQKLVDLFVKLVDPLVPAINAVVFPLEKVLRVVFAISSAIAIFSVLRSTFKFFSTGFKALVGSINFFTTAFAGGALLNGLRFVLKVLQDIFVRGRTLGPTLSLVARLLVAITTPFRVIGVALGLIVFLFLDLFLRIKAFREATGGLLIIVVAIAKSILDLIGEAISPLFRLIGDIGDALGGWVDAASKSKGVFGDIIRLLQSVFRDVSSGKLTLEDVADLIRVGILKTLTDGYANVIVPIIGGIRVGIASIKFLVEELFAAIRTAIFTIAGVSLRLFVEVFGKISKAFDGIVQAAAAGLSKLAPAASAALAASFPKDLADSKVIKGLQEASNEFLVEAAKAGTDTAARVFAVGEEISKIVKETKESAQELRQGAALEEQAALAQIQSRINFRKQFQSLSDKQRIEFLRAARAAREDEAKLFDEILQRTVSLPLVNGVTEMIAQARASIQSEGGIEVGVEFSPSTLRRLREAVKEVIDLREELQELSLQDSFDQDLVSLESFFSKKEDLVLGPLQREIELAKERVKIEQDIINKEIERRVLQEGNADKETITKIIKELSANYDQLGKEQFGLSKLQISLEKALLQLTIDRRKAVEELSKKIKDQTDEQFSSLSKLREEILKLQEKGLDSSLLEIDRETREALEAAGQRYEDVVAALVKAGADVQAVQGAVNRFIDEQALIKQVGVLKRVSAAKEEAQFITGKLGEAEQRYQNVVDKTTSQVELGIIGISQARQEQAKAIEDLITKTGNARDALAQLIVGPETLEKIGPLVDDLDKRILSLRLEAQKLTGTLGAGFAAAFAELKTTAADTFTFAKNLILDLVSTGIDEVTSAIIDVAKETKSWGEAFQDAGLKILEMLSEIIIKFLLLQAVSAVLPGAGAAAGVGGTTSLLGFSKGGRIPGRGPNRDTQVVAATKGEWLVQRPAVDHYGSKFFAALNSMSIPREVLQGFLPTFGSTATVPQAVTARVSGQSTGPVPAFITPTSEGMISMLNGGRSGFLSWLADNRRAANAALGR